MLTNRLWHSDRLCLHALISHPLPARQNCSCKQQQLLLRAPSPPHRIQRVRPLWQRCSPASRPLLHWPPCFLGVSFASLFQSPSRSPLVPSRQHSSSDDPAFRGNFSACRSLIELASLVFSFLPAPTSVGFAIDHHHDGLLLAPRRPSPETTIGSLAGT